MPHAALQGRSEQLIQAMRLQEPIGEMIGDERVELIHRDIERPLQALLPMRAQVEQV